MPDFKLLPSVNGVGVSLVNHAHAVGSPASAPAVWLDASQITGLADGAAVSSWTDISGNNRHALQATSGKRPLYKTNILNSRPVVRFDGTDDFLATATFGAALTQPNTVFVVAKHTSFAASLHFVFDGTAVNGRHALYRDNSGAAFKMFGGTAAITGPAEDTNWHVRGGIFNDGVLSSLLTDGAAVTGFCGGNPLHGVTLGADYAGTSGFLNGDIAEVLVYNRLLTSDDRTYVENYLFSKYGVGVYHPLDSFAAQAKWMTD